MYTEKGDTGYASMTRSPSMTEEEFAKAQMLFDRPSSNARGQKLFVPQNILEDLVELLILAAHQAENHRGLSCHHEINSRQAAIIVLSGLSLALNADVEIAPKR